MNCPNCRALITEEDILSEAGRIYRDRRKSTGKPSTGRPPTPTFCRFGQKHPSRREADRCKGH